ncbi:MAG: type II toxin-antitoxin system RelE/ParE family toxin [Candidatus Omnitrophica bacterium]|nr:type II toxin-antitoxin system RelE/ParE family toxin [Candidatus Omnitrophota bacterium]
MYECLYFNTASGESPVEEFINSLDSRTQRKFFYKKELLEEFGPRLPYPHAKYIGRSIYELRFEGMEGAVRVIYFFYSRDLVVFTNGFIKKSNKAPKQELSLALQRMKVFHGMRGDVK